jgi:hypothetical protein
LKATYPWLEDPFTRTIPGDVREVLPHAWIEWADSQQRWTVEFIDSGLSDGWARYYLWIHIGLGWFFGTLIVAGFAGIIKQEQ